MVTAANSWEPLQLPRGNGQINGPIKSVLGQREDEAKASMYHTLGFRTGFISRSLLLSSQDTSNSHQLLKELLPPSSRRTRIQNQTLPAHQNAQLMGCREGFGFMWSCCFEASQILKERALHWNSQNCNNPGGKEGDFEGMEGPKWPLTAVSMVGNVIYQLACMHVHRRVLSYM